MIDWPLDALVLGVAALTNIYEGAGRMVNVDDEIGKLIGREGGYSNNPADTGGATRWGITERVARAQGYAGDMRQLPRETAIAIYKRLYWLKPKLDRVAEIAPRVAVEMLDTGVNMGPAVAVTFLQRALNALNRGGADYADIGLDGANGPATLAALAAFVAKRGPAGDGVLLTALNALQGTRYIELAERRGANETFLFGWLANRVGALA